MQTRECGCMQEAQIDATLKELDIDLIVLARYMQAHILMHTHEPACASPVHACRAAGVSNKSVRVPGAACARAAGAQRQSF